jgi:16S rRNA (cytosine967-C5)-methyltransferase
MARQKLFESYLITASILVQQYDGSVPLSEFLKQYFYQHKKFGSRDRKHITHLCYCFYRAAPYHQKNALKDFDEKIIQQRILTALFLCSQNQNELLEQLNSEWNKKTEYTLEEKISLLNYSCNVTDIFPWTNELSTAIDAGAFAASHLLQPDLFLRIRPGKKQPVLRKLQEHAISFTFCSQDCLSLANTTKVEDALEMNREVIVQDHSSQRIKEFLQAVKQETVNEIFPIDVWDCCAASGGKSILAVDILQYINLTVSDIRSSIILNLKKRFKEAGIKSYHSFVIDLTTQTINLQPLRFNLIICDAPCTGSGTWGRTPEQRYFFNKEKINYYNQLQKKIVTNTIPYLAQNGFYLYITCSVFKKENEEVVEFIQKNFSMQLVKQEVLIGYDKKADTMFAALFKNT